MVVVMNKFVPLAIGLVLFLACPSCFLEELQTTCVFARICKKKRGIVFGKMCGCGKKDPTKNPINQQGVDSSSDVSSTEFQDRKRGATRENLIKIFHTIGCGESSGDVEMFAKTGTITGNIIRFFYNQTRKK